MSSLLYYKSVLHAQDRNQPSSSRTLDMKAKHLKEKQSTAKFFQSMTIIPALSILYSTAFAFILFDNRLKTVLMANNRYVDIFFNIQYENKNNFMLPYSEKFWRGFNLAQGENYIFAADLIWRGVNFF